MHNYYVFDPVCILSACKLLELFIAVGNSLFGLQLVRSRNDRMFGEIGQNLTLYSLVLSHVLSVE